MKKLVVFLIFCIYSLSYGQKEKVYQLQSFDNRPIRYGFYLGLHQKGYDLSSSSGNATINNGAGFHLGVLADLKISEYMSFLTEPGIISSSNTLTFPTNIDNEGEDFDLQVTYFNLPVSLKLSTKRINNVRGFILGGVAYNYNFTAEKHNSGENKDSDFSLKRHSLLGQIGIGASFYFPYFKFSPSIRGVYGFQNEFIGLGNSAKAHLNELRTRGVFLTLTFQ